MVRPRLTADNGIAFAPLPLRLFVEAFVEAERTMRATAEIQLDVNTTTAQYTDVGRALLVACRIAAGRPAWQRFVERHVVEVDGWRVTLTPDARGGFYTEDLAVEPIVDQVEAKKPRARRKASGKEAGRS